MAFFRRKSKEEDLEELKDIVERTTIPNVQEEEAKEGIKPEEPSIPEERKVEEEAPQIEETVSAPEKEPERSAFAPLFVKIEKYRKVLDHMSDLRTTIIMLKNALSVQRQIEGLREENRKFLELAVDKIDKKIISLDIEFLRPKGLEEEFQPATYETEGLEGVVNDLKKQIEGLKSELKTIT